MTYFIIIAIVVLLFPLLVRATSAFLESEAMGKLLIGLDGKLKAWEEKVEKKRS